VEMDCLFESIWVGEADDVEFGGVRLAHPVEGRPREPPLQQAGLTDVGEDQPARVHRRDLLGGRIHEYRRAA
jgi:hypothetical protein